MHLITTQSNMNELKSVFYRALTSNTINGNNLPYVTEYWTGIKWFDENQEKPTEEEVVKKFCVLKYQEDG